MGWQLPVRQTLACEFAWSPLDLAPARQNCQAILKYNATRHSQDKGKIGRPAAPGSAREWLGLSRVRRPRRRYRRARRACRWPSGAPRPAWSADAGGRPGRGRLTAAGVPLLLGLGAARHVVEMVDRIVDEVAGEGLDREPRAVAPVAGALPLAAAHAREPRGEHGRRGRQLIGHRCRVLLSVASGDRRLVLVPVRV